MFEFAGFSRPNVKTERHHSDGLVIHIERNGNNVQQSRANTDGVHCRHAACKGLFNSLPASRLEFAAVQLRVLAGKGKQRIRALRRHQGRHVDVSFLQQIFQKVPGSRIAVLLHQSLGLRLCQIVAPDQHVNFLPEEFLCA